MAQSPVTRRFAACKPTSSAKVADDVPVIGFGRTGSGKSTFLSIAMGAEASIADGHVVLSAPNNAPQQRFPRASHKFDSETTVSSLWRGADGTMFIDTAGLGDNREDGSAVWADGALDLALRHVRTAKVVVCFPSNVFERPRAADFDPYVLEPVQVVAAAMGLAALEAVEQLGFVANGPSFCVPTEFLEKAKGSVVDEVAKLQAQYPSSAASGLLQQITAATGSSRAASRLLQSVGAHRVAWNMVTGAEQKQFDKKVLRCIVAQCLASVDVVFVCSISASSNPGVLFKDTQRYLRGVQTIANAPGTAVSARSLNLAKEMSDFAAAVSPKLSEAARILKLAQTAFAAEDARLALCNQDYARAKEAEIAAAAQAHTVVARHHRKSMVEAERLRSDASPVFCQAKTLAAHVGWMRSFFVPAEDQCYIQCPAIITHLEWITLKGNPTKKVVDGTVGESQVVMLRAFDDKSFSVEARAFIATNADSKTRQVAAQYDQQAKKLALEVVALKDTERELAMVSSAEQLMRFILRDFKDQRSALETVLPELLERSGPTPSVIVAAQGAVEWIAELTAADVFAAAGMDTRKVWCDDLVAAVEELQPLLDAVSASNGAAVLGDALHGLLKASTAVAIAAQRREHTDGAVSSVLPGASPGALELQATTDADIAGLRSAAAARDKEIAQLKTDRALKDVAITELQAAKDASISEIALKDAAITELQVKLAQVQRETCEAVQATTNAAIARLEKYDALKDAALERLKQEAQTKDAAIAQLKTDVATKDIAFAHLEIDIASKDETITKLKAANDAALDQLRAAQDSTIAQLKDDATSKDETITKLKAANDAALDQLRAAQDSTIARLEADATSKDETITKLKAANDAALDQLRAAQDSNLAQLEADAITQLETKVATQDTAIAQLQTDGATKDAAIAQLRADGATKDAAIAQLQTDGDILGHPVVVACGPYCRLHRNSGQCNTEDGVLALQRERDAVVTALKGVIGQDGKWCGTEGVEAARILVGAETAAAVLVRTFEEKHAHAVSACDAEPNDENARSHAVDTAATLQDARESHQTAVQDAREARSLFPGLTAHVGRSLDDVTEAGAAAAAGDAEQLERLIKRNPEVVKWPDTLGVPPLHAAARAGHEACVRLLLAYGADPLTVSSDGSSAIRVAAHHAAVVTALASAMENRRAGGRSLLPPAPSSAAQPSTGAPVHDYPHESHFDDSVHDPLVQGMYSIYGGTYSDSAPRSDLQFTVHTDADVADDDVALGGLATYL